MDSTTTTAEATSDSTTTTAEATSDSTTTTAEATSDSTTTTAEATSGSTSSSSPTCPISLEPIPPGAEVDIGDGAVLDVRSALDMVLVQGCEAVHPYTRQRIRPETIRHIYQRAAEYPETRPHLVRLGILEATEQSEAATQAVIEAAGERFRDEAATESILSGLLHQWDRMLDATIPFAPHDVVEMVDLCITTRRGDHRAAQLDLVRPIANRLRAEQRARGGVGRSLVRLHDIQQFTLSVFRARILQELTGSSDGSDSFDSSEEPDHDEHEETPLSSTPRHLTQHSSGSVEHGSDSAAPLSLLDHLFYQTVLALGEADAILAAPFDPILGRVVERDGPSHAPQSAAAAFWTMEDIG
jgi:hypothetical protein